MLSNSVGQRRPAVLPTEAWGPNPARHLFLGGSGAKNVSYILKWLEKNQKKNNIL